MLHFVAKIVALIAYNTYIYAIIRWVKKIIGLDSPRFMIILFVLSLGQSDFSNIPFLLPIGRTSCTSVTWTFFQNQS